MDGARVVTEDGWPYEHHDFLHENDLHPEESSAGTEVKRCRNIGS